MDMKLLKIQRVMMALSKTKGKHLKAKSPQEQYLENRARAINKSVKANMTVQVPVDGNRFMVQVAGNNLVVADSKTYLKEIVSEPAVGHGMVIRDGGKRTYGGYGTIVEEAKKRLIIRAANGERASELEKTDFIEDKSESRRRLPKRLAIENKS